MAERGIDRERLVIFQAECGGGARAGVKRLPHHLRGRPISEDGEEQERRAEQGKTEQVAQPPTPLSGAIYARAAHGNDAPRCAFAPPRLVGPALPSGMTLC